ncbi:MAG TPA: DinB family protein [Ignavibacteria bacterium]|nr:DinB family protein [Ignavibacteria bacterium]
MSYKIKEDLDKTFEELKDTLDKFNQESFNKAPQYGGWNAGEVCEHLVKSNVTSLIYGNLEETDRVKDEKVPELEQIFMDFSAKYTNPEFNNPEKSGHDMNEMKEALKKIHNDALKAAEERNLTKICTDMELPGSGQMTGFELLYFMVFHYKRHTNQIKNILAGL